MEKEAAEAHISQVISDMLGFKVGYKDYQMEHGVERVLTLPGMKNYNDITYGALDAALNKLGVKQGRVRYALANVRRSGIEEYAEFIGSSNKYSKFAGIHWGMREMEMIESRMARFNTTGGPDISPLYRALRSNAYNLLPEQIAENKSILNVVELARNKRLDGDYKVLSVEDVSNLRQQPARLGGNTVSDFTGTILDKSIAEGSDGFIIKLPGNIEIGKNRYVNELFMPALDLKKRVADGIFRPDDVQKYQLGIQEAIRQYSIGIQGDSKLAERAYGKLTNLVPKYILQAGNELVGSKGSMVKNTFEDYLKHSGRTIAQGFSVADMFDASGDVLRDKDR
jgi:hypothetical protein